MSTEQISNESANESEPAEVETSTEQTEGNESESQKDEAGEPELDLDSAKKALAKARNEAGKYRTRLRDAEDKLSKAKTPEEFEAAVTELRDTNAKLERDLLVERVARKAALPEELAELLQGSTEAELQAHAKKLARYVTTANAPGDLRGGLDPTDEDDFDPVKAAHAAKRTRY